MNEKELALWILGGIVMSMVFSGLRKHKCPKCGGWLRYHSVPFTNTFKETRQCKSCGLYEFRYYNRGRWITPGALRRLRQAPPPAPPRKRKGLIG